MTQQSSERAAEGAPESSIHGYPRIGRKRELKFAIERFWSGSLDDEALHAAGAAIRKENWESMTREGISLVPFNDFSFYDQMLDTSLLLGCIPPRFSTIPEAKFARYFAMARGVQDATHDIAPLEMTKWFDTNYHQLVPEIPRSAAFSAESSLLTSAFTEFRQHGSAGKAVLIGPLTYLLRSKPEEKGPSLLQLLPQILRTYKQLLGDLALVGVPWVQLDEPVLVEDINREILESLEHVCTEIGGLASRPKLCISTYFGTCDGAMSVLSKAPIDAIGLDFCSGAEPSLSLSDIPALKSKTLFAGVVDGRRVWVNDMGRTIELLNSLSETFSHIVVSSSCSFQYVPISAAAEHEGPDDLLASLSFAEEKLHEIGVISQGFHHGTSSVSEELAKNREQLERLQRLRSAENPAVRKRLANLQEKDLHRKTPVRQRYSQQQEQLLLPLFPTTTIGSFPQTEEIRAARTSLLRNEITEKAYEVRIQRAIEGVVALQEMIGIDVIVHGEAERNDMVQYFAEQMEGYFSTANGWVQSFGTRCTRPPIIYGDISRTQPMTVDLAEYAQSLTLRPVKGMLTGPITMMKWAYLRDDLSPQDIAHQIALAIRDEILDLEEAGISIIQVDEPAFREAMPLRRADRDEYLAWATAAFRLATSGVSDRTQIHTHMCYSEFGSIIEALKELDADVISFEAARSSMGLLEDLRHAKYEGCIGPGIYDIHSPRVPESDEIVDLLEKALEVVDPLRLWINPDCGLKTRKYDEVEPALYHLVDAAQRLRAKYLQFV